MAITLDGSLSSPQSLSSPNRTDRISEQLSSGERITSAAIDAAGSAISEGLTRQIDGFDAALRNAGDSISALQVADGALSSVNDNISRIQELTIQAGNGTLSEQDRQALQEEADQLVSESNRILESTNFNGKSLLAAEEDFSVQLGEAGETIPVQSKNVAQEIKDIGFNQVDLSSPDAANASLETLNQASDLIVARQSEIGASSNRIESAAENISASRIDSAEARSRISDTDYAQAASDLVASQIRDEVQLAVQGQANGQRDSILRLLS